MLSFKVRMERFSIKATPSVLTLLLVLFAAIPLHIPGLDQLMPSFVLISIYFWGTFLPGALSFLFLFALGLLQDTLSGQPLGISSLINMVFALLFLWEYQSFGKLRFSMMWLGFVLLSLVVLALQWFILSCYWGTVLPPLTHILQWIATCFAYPLMHWLLTRLYQLLTS